MRIQWLGQHTTRSDTRADDSCDAKCQQFEPHLIWAMSRAEPEIEVHAGNPRCARQTKGGERPIECNSMTIVVRVNGNLRIQVTHQMLKKVIATAAIANFIAVQKLVIPRGVEFRARCAGLGCSDVVRNRLYR
jgi:hypothetical protein